MPILPLIILFSALEALLSLIGGLLLLWRESLARQSSFYLVNFATGALLSAAFLGLLPEALEGAVNQTPIFLLILAGIFAAFLIERILSWHHAHEEKEVHTFTYLVILGDTVHNFVDGVVIGASFLVSVPLGIVTTFAVVLHEIPQEIGDFAILLQGGMTRAKVLVFNLFSSFSTILGAITAFFFGSFVSAGVPFLLALAVGGFIYIATADLIPEISKERRLNYIMIQLLLFLSGIAVIFLAEQFTNL